jgi:uncharacterized protein YndB with AHSA1/START domain
LYDIAMQVDIAARPQTVYAALTSAEGVAGWWTTRSEPTADVGGTSRFHFPDAPVSWDMKVTEAVDGERLTWQCTGGPPQWVGTTVVWTLAPAGEEGTCVVFDHTGFAAKDEMFRVVTVGWAQMLERLRRYAETGEPVPYFDF